MPKNYTKEELKNGRWVTMKGARVFIKEGENPQDAFDRALNRSPKKEEKTIEERNETFLNRYYSRSMNKFKWNLDKKEQWAIENLDIQYLTKYKGEPATFEVYRAGDIEGKATGGVYFDVNERAVDAYKSGSFSSGGKTYRYSKREVNKYKVSVKKPLFVEDSGLSAARFAFHKIYGKNVTMKEINERLNLGYKFTGGLNNTWIFLDMANIRGLRKAGYDSIIYTSTFRPTQKPMVTEIIVPARSKSIRLVKDR